ncbi:unnamed protein product, partial [Effrenium voratum]
RKPYQNVIQDFKADEGRLYDNWAWIGQLESKLDRAKRHAKKLRRKLQFPNDPDGQKMRLQQRRYWEQQGQR